MILVHLAIARISADFEYGTHPAQRPIVLCVCIGMIAGVLYLFAALAVRKIPYSKTLLAWAIAAGFIMRAVLMNSTPILEDDYYRYLWDGAVTASGINPYSYAPGLFIEDSEDRAVSPSGLRRLAEGSGVVVSRVNHPDLRTIYPPVAQGAFALAHLLRPWSLFAWRLVLLVFDVAVLCILLAILRTLNLPLLWLVIYWWNPVLIKETYNSGHMDVIALPFVLGAVLLSVRNRRLMGIFSLALAAGAKLWPVVLAPVFLRPMIDNRRKLAVAMCVLVVLCAAMFLPVYAGGLDSESGFTAYGKRWEMNDALFMLILWGCRYSMEAAGLHPGGGQLAARVVVLLILSVSVGLLLRGGIKDGRDLCGKCLFVVAAIFLMSPTQFPWYFIWMLPFLAIRPRASLLLLTVLLPLYYLRFYFAARGSVGTFDYGIVWLEFVPVWLLLAWEWLGGRRKAGLEQGVPA